MATGGSGTYTYYWIPDDKLINPTSFAPETQNLTETTWFVLTVTDMQTGCVGVDSVMITVLPQYDPPVAVDDYDTTYSETTVTVDVLMNDTYSEFSNVSVSLCGAANNGLLVVNSNGTITYTPNSGFSGSDQFCYSICDAGLGDQCDTATVFIEVLSKDDPDRFLHIYNAFTPNGDGSNDRWFIKNIDLYPDNDVVIFNRWGDIVKELSHYDNDNIFWDGTDKNGNLLPDGTFYYVLKIYSKGKTYKYDGWIYMYGSR